MRVMLYNEIKKIFDLSNGKKINKLVFIGAFGLTRKCAIPAYLVGETCGLPRANAVRPYGKERRFYISNSPTNLNLNQR